MTAVDPLRYPLDVDRYRTADHRWLDEVDHHVVHTGEPHHRMGTRQVDEHDWLRIDEHRPGELALRRRLVEEIPDAVVAHRPGSETAAAEVAATVHDWLGAHRPDALVDWDRPVDDPPLRAALAVQEDLCVMQPVAGGWRLTAAVVCFPTSWRLGDKIGRAQPEIHRPVPHFDNDLATRVDRFFDRLTPGRIAGRRNWGITPHPLLFVPDSTAIPAPALDVERLWLRSERQTLRRLPDTGAVLFTIRVQLAPLTALADRPRLAAAIADTIDAWPADLAADRLESHDWRGSALPWLRAIARGS